MKSFKLQFQVIVILLLLIGFIVFVTDVAASEQKGDALLIKVEQPVDYRSVVENAVGDPVQTQIAYDSTKVYCSGYVLNSAKLIEQAGVDKASDFAAEATYVALAASNDIKTMFSKYKNTEPIFDAGFNKAKSDGPRVYEQNLAFCYNVVNIDSDFANVLFYRNMEYESLRVTKL